MRSHSPLYSLALVSTVFVLTVPISAQSVGINTQNPHPSSVLDVQSVQAGALLPRLTTAQRNQIQNPAIGLIIFNTDTECLNVYNSNGWNEVCGNCIAPPLPVISGGGAVCAGSAVTLSTTPQAGATYVWSGPNGFTGNTPSLSIPSVQTTEAGTYQLFTVVSGCTSQVATTVLTVNALPVAPITVTPTQPIINQPATISTTAGGTLSWTFGSGTPATSTTASNTVTWTTGGTYTLTLSVIQNGCTTTVSQPVTVSTCPAQPQGQSATFNFTGSSTTFTVPPCVQYIDVDVYGGQGFASNSASLGLGGRVQARVQVTPGEVLHIFVGGAGTSTTGGFNGGGNAGSSTTYGAGGGASDIRRGGTSLNDRIVVAGGGGGTGSNCGTNTAPGGPGGGLTGGNGCSFSCSSCQYTGSGGTQTAGGIAGPTGHSACGGNNNGSFGIGGSNTGGSGTGGGGGWYGGGSGCYEGAGGGSSYVIPTGTSNVVHTQGTRVGNGMIVISY